MNLFSISLSVFQSQSVDDKHAVFKWEHRSAAFTVKDLGSVNGVSTSSVPVL